MGIGTSWPPFVMYEVDSPTGLDIEITSKVLEKAGLCYEYVVLPSSARGLNELDKGLVDILPSASFNTERAKMAHFSLPYRRERMRLFSLEPDESAKNLSELFASDNTFTANPGAYYGEELAEIMRIEWYQKRLFEVPTLERRMQMVLMKRVNYLIEDEVAGSYYAQKNDLRNVKMHTYVVNDNAIYFMLGRKSFEREQVDKINQAILNLASEIKVIEAKYTNVLN
ncbi:extracellular solute-binding proteins, family 3 protein [Pseudoalteromonas luteoviolacea B = ATCC 29581]|nr:extracellular solute-binding proteins, family 3 protein [Pseudoalteromonas luteoviolacea B = ATCC 29581]